MNNASSSSDDRVSRVAVIGAGMSGLIAARVLVDNGIRVTVFEKSRGVGGRMATRRVEGASSFDHGAQYFTVRDPQFRDFVDSWIQKGIVNEWPNSKVGEDQKIVVIIAGKIESESKSTARFVGVPAMNSICKYLVGDLDIQTEVRVSRIESVDAKIHLSIEESNSLGSFDRLIVSAPAEQTAELLKGYPEISDPISKIKMNPCWAAMVSFERPVTDKWVGAFLHDSFLTWAARNSSKPGRSRSNENLLIHAGPQWTAENWERDAVEVAREMLHEFWQVSGLTSREPVQLQGHRWKYAIPIEPSEQGCYFDEGAGIAACGDWASGSRVEGAFLSGMAAANRIIESLSDGNMNNSPE